jgi:chemotaxis signal transduction protein
MQPARMPTGNCWIFSSIRKVDVHMAKPGKIFDQKQALSAYFRDMLAETRPHTLSDETAETRISAATKPIAEPVAVVAADEEIKLLLCDVAGMAVAVPIAALDNIITWPDTPLTRIPGEPEWVLGVCSDREAHTRVADISRLLSSETGSEIQQTPAYILLVGNRRWGIACNRLRKIVTLTGKDINWRSDLTQRPWFRGVLVDSMSSVLDVDTLIAALQNA